MHLLFEAQREILGPHPCTIIRVRAVINLLKNHCQSAYHVEGKFETHFCQFVDIGAGRQTLLTWVRLRLRLRAALDYELQVLPIFSSGIVQPAKRQRAWKSPHTRKARRGGEREKFFSLAAASRLSRAGWFSRALAWAWKKKKGRQRNPLWLGCRAIIAQLCRLREEVESNFTFQAWFGVAVVFFTFILGTDH